MAYSIKDYKGRNLYIKGNGKYYYLTKDKRGAMTEIPEGWQIVRLKNSRLVLRKSKN